MYFGAVSVKTLLGWRRWEQLGQRCPGTAQPGLGQHGSRGAQRAAAHQKKAMQAQNAMLETRQPHARACKGPTAWSQAGYQRWHWQHKEVPGWDHLVPWAGEALPAPHVACTQLPIAPPLRCQCDPSRSMHAMMSFAISIPGGTWLWYFHPAAAEGPLRFTPVPPFALKGGAVVSYAQTGHSKTADVHSCAKHLH